MMPDEAQRPSEKGESRFQTAFRIGFRPSERHMTHTPI